jgi:hypothetical protein
MGIDLDEWVNSDGERFRRKYRAEGGKIILFAGTKGYNKRTIFYRQRENNTVTGLNERNNKTVSFYVVRDYSFPSKSLFDVVAYRDWGAELCALLFNRS